MNNTWILATAFIEGSLLGAVFFGGLWWTIQRSISAAHAGLLFSGSLFVRTSIFVVGLYFVSQHDWRRVVACLLGFMASRIVITRLLNVQESSSINTVEEGGL
jgi:F1F0 ATPase subunit 2